MPPKILPFGAKALQAICCDDYLLALEGAVRSSKTVSLQFAWLRFLCKTPDRVHIMSGKSLGSLSRNVINGDFGLLEILGDLARYHSDRDGNRILTIQTPNGVKDCYCFGANDDASFKALRGLTAGGWLADEVNMQAKSFVEEAFRRTMNAADGFRRHMWSLNPSNPNHWLYKEYLDAYEDMAKRGEPVQGGFTLLKYKLDDNPSMTETRKREIRAQYSGVFYRMYIEGERCLAEGAIYGMLDHDNYYYNTPGLINGKERKVRPVGLPYLSQRFVGGDYGATVPSAFLDIYDDGETLWVDREYYYDPRLKNNLREKDPAELTEDFKRFRDGEQFDGHEFTGCPVPLSGFSPSRIVEDPRANALITTMRNAGIPVETADTDVLEGILHVSTMLSKRRILINKDNCPNHVKEMAGYAWDEKAAMMGESKPMKINDHSVDVLRYIVMTCLPSFRYADLA